MKAIVCEMCGSHDVVKQEEYYVCQACDTKYSTEAARKLMVEVEGKVDVSGSTIKIDQSDELNNLYVLARRARKENDSDAAAKHYEAILIKNPSCWEASFYSTYFRSINRKMGEINLSADAIKNALSSSLTMIAEKVERDNVENAFSEVANTTIIGVGLMYEASKGQTDEAMYQLRVHLVPTFIKNGLACSECLYSLGDKLMELFPDSKKAETLAVTAWKKGVEIHNLLLERYAYTNMVEIKTVQQNIAMKYVQKIQMYHTFYSTPSLGKPSFGNSGSSSSGASSGGCYVATCVYGSYDCPQVWTLRRYRDEKLAVTWHGRLLIKIYYAISPTLVKWFGKTIWFKQIWKPTLDRMVEQLCASGVENTPYCDKHW